jgi:hypothetical protein
MTQRVVDLSGKREIRLMIVVQKNKMGWKNVRGYRGKKEDVREVKGGKGKGLRVRKGRKTMQTNREKTTDERKQQHQTYTG